MVNDQIYQEIEKLEENSQYQEAIELIIKTYNNNPKENHLLLQAAVNAIDLEDWDLFINLAEKYLQIDDKKLQLRTKDSLFMIYHHLGVGYALKEDYENAIRYFQNAIKHKTKDNTLAYLAQCYEYIGETEKAISFWNTAAKMGNGEAILALNSRGISL